MISKFMRAIPKLSFQKKKNKVYRFTQSNTSYMKVCKNKVNNGFQLWHIVQSNLSFFN